MLAGVGLLTKPFWKRIATFFCRWWERDMRAEQRRREEAECRRKAQEEVSEFCHDDILQGKAPAPSVENAQTGASTTAESAAVSGQAAAPPPVATLRLMGSHDLQNDLHQNDLYYEEDQERERK